MEDHANFQYDKLLLQFRMDSADGMKDRGLNFPLFGSQFPVSLTKMLSFQLAPYLAFAPSRFS